MTLKKRIIILLAITFGHLTISFAWNSRGHQIVAAIAYRQLTPTTKEKVNQLTQALFKTHSGYWRFLHAATWPDQLKYQGITLYNKWHYYPQISGAIKHSHQELQNTRLSFKRRAFYLSMWVHLVGDAHQPLHCVTNGENDFYIKGPIANNLHQYWDRGAGLFDHHRMNTLVKQIMQQYPPSFFGEQINDLNPNDWVSQNATLVRKAVLKTPRNKSPSRAYRRHSQALVKQQLALAGERLAVMLNQLFMQ